MTYHSFWLDACAGPARTFAQQESEEAMAEGSGFEMQPHEKTYASFTRLFKWGAVVCLLAALFIMFLIAG